MANNQQVLIEHLPEGKLQASDYRLSEAPVPEPQADEVLCETIAFAITAGTRAGLQGSASYAGAPRTGIVMNATGVARVIASRSDAFKEGDVVLGPTGWQTHAALPAAGLTHVPAQDDPLHYLGPLGVNGLTAYFGLNEVGAPEPGNTVLVSAAAGSVGHLVGQFAAARGARAVGLSSSDAKCDVLTSRLGFAAAVNYREDNFRSALKEATPDGVDVYFDNTGGPLLGAALFRMNVGGRISCCGVVSQYDTDRPEPGPKGIPGLLVNKRLTMRGFLVFDFAPRYDEARAQIRSWLADGSVVSLTDEVNGLAAAPDAFVDLLAGGNVGTRIVRLA
ncbi:MAG: NADP-dependent oxidoreductase [Pseudomonadota bacterium]